MPATRVLTGSAPPPPALNFTPKRFFAFLVAIPKRFGIISNMTTNQTTSTDNFLVIIIGEGRTFSESKKSFATYKEAEAFAKDHLGDWMTHEYLGSREPRLTGYRRIECFRQLENEIFCAILSKDE